MAVSVSMRTVWFAVCRDCIRLNATGGSPPSFPAVVLSFQSETDRGAWQLSHNRAEFETHPDEDYVVWDVTAMVHDA